MTFRFSVHGTIRQGGRRRCFHRHRNLLVRGNYCLIVADSSLSGLAIAQGDRLLLSARPYYNDGEMVLCCRTEAAVASSAAPHYIGRYRQIGDLVSIVLPDSSVLAGNIVVIAGVDFVCRVY